MLAIGIEKNRSTKEQMILTCWVCEGTARVGDTLNYAAIYNVTGHGFSPKSRKLRLSYELTAYHSIDLTLQKIRRYLKGPYLSVADEGEAYTFDIAAPRAEDWDLIRTIIPKKEAKLSWEGRGTVTELILFDTQASAHAYTHRMLNEVSFQPTF